MTLPRDVGSRFMIPILIIEPSKGIFISVRGTSVGAYCIGEKLHTLEVIRLSSGLPLAVVPILDMRGDAFIISAVVVRYKLDTNLQVCFF